MFDVRWCLIPSYSIIFHHIPDTFAWGILATFSSSRQFSSAIFTLSSRRRVVARVASQGVVYIDHVTEEDRQVIAPQLKSLGAVGAAMERSTMAIKKVNHLYISMGHGFHGYVTMLVITRW